MKEKQTKIKKKRKKMKLWKKIVLVILLILAILIGWFIYKVEENGGGLTGVLATLAGHDKNTRKNLGEFRCLLLGISTDQEGVDLTDTIIVLSYNPATQEATMLSIPRDTYTGSNPEYATAYEKINALYSRQHRADETLEKVNEITGLDIPYYIVVQTEALIKLVDTIGGVDFDVPIDMDYDDESQDLHIHLTAGEQHLDGDKAEQVLRFRHNNNGTSYPSEYGDNDEGRMRTQRDFIVTTMRQTLKPDNIGKIFDIIDIAKEYIITNVNFDVAKDYVPYAVEFDTLDMQTGALPGYNTNQNSSGTWVFVYNRQETAELVKEMFKIPDEEEPQIDENGNIIASTKKRLNIQLVNGTGDSNKKEIALHELKSLGHNVDAVDTNEIEKTVIIKQSDIDTEQIKNITDTLQEGIVQSNVEDEAEYDLLVVLGKDYENE